MKFVVIAAVSLGTMSVLANCSTSQPINAEANKHPDPMSSIWNDYGTRIDSLATQGTSIQAWQALSPESKVIITKESELRKILSRYDSLSNDQIDHYCRLLKRAKKTVHYGFELDFRALVFFDEDDRTIEVFVMSS